MAQTNLSHTSGKSDGILSVWEGNTDADFNQKIETLRESPVCDKYVANQESPYKELPFVERWISGELGNMNE